LQLEVHHIKNIAPEEADSQLAYHPTSGEPTEFVITVDSDLLAFGHKRIIIVDIYHTERYR
jgi:5'-3' exonuclease